jgi:hypothetical protein
MAGKFDFLKTAKSGAAIIEAGDPQPPADLTPAGQEGPRTGRPRSKSSDPRYRPITVVLQKQTIRRARRKLEDDELDQDLSDLVQQLLTEWMGEK